MVGGGVGGKTMLWKVVSQLAPLLFSQITSSNGSEEKTERWLHV